MPLAWYTTHGIQKHIPKVYHFSLNCPVSKRIQWSDLVVDNEEFIEEYSGRVPCSMCLILESSPTSKCLTTSLPRRVYASVSPDRV